MVTDKGYNAVVIGVSTGGLHALETLLPLLPADYDLPVIVVQHRVKRNNNFLCRFLDELCPLSVVAAEEKMAIMAGQVYIAPPNYHLLIEADRSLSLSVDPLVNWSRPSIDVLFETAAEVYRGGLVGVVLTGANKDGSKGLARIKQLGGLAVIQDPQTAEALEMPQAAIDTVGGDHILPLAEIGQLLASLNYVNSIKAGKNEKTKNPDC